ncbi:MAG: hypothetical protein JNL02_04645 [Saprospiraceae bacterium]|nr:hypothetical protein [Saprospiraceae bacterium]
MITKKIVADQILSYLQHQITLEELVDWAENALLNGDFQETDIKLLTPIIARLGVTDVKSFGLSWDDCENMIHQLGYTLSVKMLESAA